MKSRKNNSTLSKTIFPEKIKTFEDYQNLYSESLRNPDQFWEQIASQKILWRRSWSKVSDCDYLSGKVRWFLDAELNVAENCVDRHILEGRGDHRALIWVGNEPGEERILSFNDLYREVFQMSHALEARGLRKGDRLAIYLPNIPELAITVLACARLGIIHTVIFGGFSASSIQSRVEDCGAKMMITADGSYRGNKWINLKANVDEAVALGCPSLETVVVYKRHPDRQDLILKQKKEVSWEEFLASARELPIPLPSQKPSPSHSAQDPLFILYTSGSTGKPKGVLHKMGGYLTYAAYTFATVFRPQSKDVYWCTADVGWITGHSYLIYGPLACGITTLMFEGIPTYPDPSRFWQIVDQYQVSIFYSAPTAIRTLASEGDQYVHATSRSSLRTLGTVGEPINPEAWKWYYDVVGNGRCSVVDTWWQTETGGIMIAPLAGITPTLPGSATFPIPGIEIQLLDEQGKQVPGEGAGALVVCRSWPGQMSCVYNDPDRFYETYFKQFPGYYAAGDGAYRDSAGYYWITGRTDDVIKVSGHRLGTAEIEAACVNHPSVIEAAAVGVPDPKTGECLQLFVVLKSGTDGTSTLIQEIIQVVRKGVGTLATPQKVYVIPGLPKTRSGKIMRRILRKMAVGEFKQLGDISTLADATIVERMIDAIKKT